MDSIKVEHGATRMVAHRGLSGIELENTNAAFIAAGNRSYFGIETDVHKTSDGKFVVFHDDNTGRVGERDVVVEETPFSELRAMKLIARDGDTERIDMRIPTLREYISTCKRYEKKAVLELKNEFTADEIRAILDEIEAEGYLDQVIFISFAFINLVHVRSFYPEQEVQFLTSKYADDLNQILKAHRFDIDIEYTQLTKERIEKFHAYGVKVNCWTCDDKAFAEDLCSWGIDFITSNILE